MSKAHYPNAGEVLNNLQRRLDEKRQKEAEKNAMTAAGGVQNEMPIM
jgi:Flp pilus assembly protein TadB